MSLKISALRLTQLAQVLFGGALVVTYGYVAGCGGNSDSTYTVVVAPSSLVGIPKVTGPVISTATSTSSSSTGSKTGVTLAKFASTFSGSSNAKAMCESGSVLRDFYREAANPDRASCYMGVLEKHGILTSSLYDSQSHYYDFTGFSSPLNGHMRFTVSLSKSLISSYQLAACIGSSASSTQTEYVSATFSGTSATMTTVESNALGGTRTTVKGNLLDSTGAWTSKSMTENQQWSNLTNSNTQQFTWYNVYTLKQASGTLTLSGATKGSVLPSPVPSASPSASPSPSPSPSASPSASPSVNPSASPSPIIGVAEGVSLSAVMQGIGMTKLSTFAIGDGSANFLDKFIINGTSTTDALAVESWTGDSKQALSSASSGTYYGPVVDSIPPGYNTPVYSFQSDETWDCTPDGGNVTTVTHDTATATDTTLDTDLATCDTTYGGITDTSYIDCSAGK